MGNNCSEQINTLSEYIGKIEEIIRKDRWTSHYGTIFRGQGRDLPLLPKLLREINGRIYNKIKINEVFNSYYKAYVDFDFADEVEKICYMQHYGMPTRLLDFTANPLVALYFAVNDTKLDDSPTVYCLRSGSLNEIYLDDFSSQEDNKNEKFNGVFLNDNYAVMARIVGTEYTEGNYYECAEKWKIPSRYINGNAMKSPITFFGKSSFQNKRLPVQKGLFSIHGTDERDIETILKGSDKDKDLIKIKINPDKASELRNELKLMGFSPLSIFPDIDGLAQELNLDDYKINKP